MRVFAKTLLGVAAAGLMAGSAAAETLSVGGVIPARTDAGLGVFTLSVDRIDGRDGAKLEFELKQALDRVEIRGEDWFDIVPFGGGEVDAIITGSASSRTARTELDPKEVETCAEKDPNDKDKCLRYKITLYDCTRYEVSFYPDIEIVGYEGDVIYAVRDEMRASADHCEDEDNRPSMSGMVNGMIGEFVRDVRFALAPFSTRKWHRVLERRSGLDKDDRNTFKNALKLTKSDQRAACQAFKSLGDKNPEQVSVLFNIGLCYEREGAYDQAREFYGRANAVEPGKSEIRQGFSRIRQWEEGLRQLAVRRSYLEQPVDEPAE